MVSQLLQMSVNVIMDIQEIDVIFLLVPNAIMDDVLLQVFVNVIPLIIQRTQMYPDALIYIVMRSLEKIA